MPLRTPIKGSFVGSFAFIVVAVLALNLPQIFFEPLPLFFRLIDQALLLLGLTGMVSKRKPLRALGWIGICLFIAYVVFGSLPSLDHPAFAPDGEQRPEQWMPRLILWLVISVSLVACYRKSTRLTPRG